MSMNIVSGYGAVLWWITRCVPHSRMKRASTVLAKGPPMRCGSEPFCVSVCVCVLQGSKLGLVLVQDVPGASQLFPQFCHFLSEGRVLLLQETGPDGDLVLLQAPRIT